MIRSIIPCTVLLIISAGAFAAGPNLPAITYATNGAGQVAFSHSRHLKSAVVADTCKKCHPGLYSLDGRRTHATMADMERGKSCGVCHNGSVAFGMKSCAKCHPTRPVTYQVAATGPVRFSHDSHSSRARCETCHRSLYKAGKNPSVGMAAMEKGKSCGACHNGTAAFSLKKCGACHPSKDKTYQVKGAGAVAFRHEEHLPTYRCGSCHPKVYKLRGGNAAVPMSAMAKGKGCGACHNGSAAFSVKENCAICHKISARS